MKNRIVSLLLALCMILCMFPMPGHVHAAEETAGSAPVCDCGTDDALIHATTCAVYVAPENPQCFCAEKCTEVNIWCDVCGFDIAACGGEGEAASFVTNPTGKAGLLYTGSNQVLINATPADTGYKWGYFAYGYSGDPMFILPDEWEPPARTEVDQYYVHCIHIPDTEMGIEELIDYCGKNKVTLTVYIYPSVTTAPVGAAGLTANGTAQTLISAEGVPAGGYEPDMLYSVTAASATSPGSFSTALPTATGVGSYKVWYKARAQSATEWGYKRLTITAPNSAAKYIIVTIGDGVTSGITWMLEGETYATTFQTAGEKLTLPATPTKAPSDCVSYTFDGWFTAAQGGERVTAETVYSASTNTTYYGRLRKVNTHDPALASYSANGFCPNGCYLPATDSNNDGIYEIANGGQLFWFADQINSGALARNTGAVLTADIDLENRDFTTICPTGLYYDTTTYSDTGYTGTFDGQGHTISNYTVKGISGTKCSVGLFGTLSGTVRNLGVTNMTFQLNGATDVRAAAIAGQMLPGSTIINCYVTDSVLAPKNYIVGGIAACNYGGSIYKCFTYRVTVDAHSRCGNLVSDCRGDLGNDDRAGTVFGCWTDAARVTGTQVPSGLAILSCYSNASAALASGEAAWNLNNSSSQGIWKQTLGTDGAPNFTGATVYKVTNCKNETAYSNTNEAIGHRYENGKCTVCGAACPGHSYENGICTVCGIACPGHSYENGKCTVCGIACPGHSYENGICTVCGAACPGHSYENGICTVCGAACDHTGGTATCTTLAVCDTCGASYGELADHTFDETTGKCVCGYQFGIYVERDIEIDGIYHETYWFDTLSDALRYAHGSTDYGQYTTQSATIKLYRDLTVAEGETFSFRKQVVLDTNGFAVTNHGTLALEGYTYSSIPAAITGGTITIGDKTYTWNGEKWICCDGSHTGSAATCASGAVCDICGTAYSEVDPTNHDSSIAYENGFCPNGCYEPAVLVDGVYQISNAGQLYWFADKVTNENEAYGSADAILTADITVNENVLAADGTVNEGTFRAWTPIGILGVIDNKRVVYTYTGTFEGNGKTVSGLYFYDTSANFTVGLFGYVGDGGIVRNVGVVDSYFCSLSAVGGVVCYNSGTVTGCYNEGTVISDNGGAGGVVEYNLYGTVTDCYNAGTVSGTTNVGGVVGSNLRERSTSTGIVTDCYNSGNVSGESEVGGVVGYINGGNVTGCYNEGTVSGTTDVGGVAGAAGGTVSNCYNGGNVSGDSKVGGVVGLTGNGTMTNCYSSGNVSGNSNVGGVAGENHDFFTLANCYFDSTVYSGDAIGLNNGAATNVEGKSTAQFASGEVAYLLSQGCTLDVEEETVTYPGDIWGQNIGTDSYPVLGGEKVYYGYLSCKEMVYTNDSSASDTRPDHSGPYTPEFQWHEPYDGECYVELSLHCTACGEEDVTYDGGYAQLTETVEPTDCKNPGKEVYEITFTYQGMQYPATTDFPIYSDDHPAFDTDGFCTVCGGYQAAVYNEDKGVYEISNAGQLYWYARKLNTENAEIYAELTRDIVIPENAPNWEPINASYVFFNGNYHTISGLKCVGDENMNYVGLFGREGWWYEISNLHIDGSYFEGNGYVGAVVACMTNGGSVTNCYVTDTTVKGGGNDTGGLVGYLGNSTMSNCYSAAAVEGENAHTLVGYCNSSATVENSYYLSETETEDGGRTAAQFASGEIAYLLQAGQEPGYDYDEEGNEIEVPARHIWGQNIGTEDYPVFGGRKVLFDQETNTYYNDTATLGDLNLDGEVDAIDLTLLARHVAQIEEVTGQALANADVNGDGIVNSDDLTKHARYVGRIITSWDQD